MKIKTSVFGICNDPMSKKTNIGKRASTRGIEPGVPSPCASVLAIMLQLDI